MSVEESSQQFRRISDVGGDHQNPLLLLELNEQTSINRAKLIARRVQLLKARRLAELNCLAEEMKRMRSDENEEEAEGQIQQRGRAQQTLAKRLVYKQPISSFKKQDSHPPEEVFQPKELLKFSRSKEPTQQSCSQSKDRKRALPPPQRDTSQEDHLTYPSFKPLRFGLNLSNAAKSLETAEKKNSSSEERVSKAQKDSSCCSRNMLASSPQLLESSRPSIRAQRSITADQSKIILKKKKGKSTSHLQKLRRLQERYSEDSSSPSLSSSARLDKSLKSLGSDYKQNRQNTQDRSSDNLLQKPLFFAVLSSPTSTAFQRSNTTYKSSLNRAIILQKTIANSSSTLLRRAPEEDCKQKYHSPHHMSSERQRQLRDEETSFKQTTNKAVMNSNHRKDNKSLLLLNEKENQMPNQPRYKLFSKTPTISSNLFSKTIFSTTSKSGDPARHNSRYAQI